MKFYVVLKWLQGFLTISLFSLFCFFSSKTDGTSGIHLLFAFSGLILCLAFLILDFSCLKKCESNEQHLALMSLTDSLTGLPNSFALKKKIEYLSESLLDDDTACVLITFENIHQLNRTYGHAAGDTTLREFGEILRTASSDLCFTGRKGGRTFLSIFKGNAQENAGLFLKRLEHGVAVHNETTGLLPISCSTRIACNKELHYASIYDLVKIRLS